MIASDCKIHGLPEVKERGPSAFHPFFQAFASAFSKIEVKIEQDDWIVFRASVRRKVETWNQWDFLTLMVGLKQTPADGLQSAIARLALARSQL
jgi:hypothetical protein